MGSAESPTFYDRHPFDWVDSKDEIHLVVARSLVALIESLNSDSLVLDVGCGPGRVLGFLARRGIRCIGLDRSRVSLGLAVKRHGTPGVVGDNLNLPFASGAADLIISDGVIHHTENPRAAFLENLRVLKSGGQMYLAVYKPSGRYPFLYKYPGGMIRRGLLTLWTRPLVVLFAQVPYFLIHLLRSKGRRTWAGARNLFYDYFVTPRVAFIPSKVVADWCTAHGAHVIHYDENLGANVHSFLVEKKLRSEPQRDPAADSNAQSPVGEKRGAV